MIDVVNAEMVRALRVVSVEQGLDPRDFALVAFGGAGPLHACALADELGMTTVLVPASAGRPLRTRPRRGRRATGRGALVRAARSTTQASSRATATRTCATPGQSFELTVPLGERLAERFHERARRTVRIRRS